MTIDHRNTVSTGSDQSFNTRIDFIGQSFFCSFRIDYLVANTGSRSAVDPARTFKVGHHKYPHNKYLSRLLK